MLFQELLYKGAHRTPEKVVFTWVDKKRQLTYEQAVDKMERAATGLAALGVGHRDRVGVFAHNGLDYLIGMFGAWRLGAMVTLVNVQLADSLDYYINDSTPKVLIYTGDHFETIDANRKNLKSVEHYICMDGPQPGAIDWNLLLEGGKPLPMDPTQETDGAHISYTSGTTGKPKGAVLAHEPTSRATHCIAERLQIRSNDVTLGPTALSSSYQLVANILPGLHRGASVSVLSRWQPSQTWESMVELNVTVLAANPPILRDLYEISKTKGKVPPSLRLVLSGGGSVSPDLKKCWRDELNIPLVESYGQSELGGFVGLGFPERVPDNHLAAVGLPLPDKEVRIVDEQDKEVAIGEVGEIVLRGGFMVGYWNQPEKTSNTLRGGWLHTGDVGKMDTEGYVYMLGRREEEIISNGRLIFPRVIEEALYSHPSVNLASVIGIPDKEAGNIPKAIVTVREGKSVQEFELLSHCRSLLSEEDCPRKIEFIDEMPMTPTGKINRAALEAREIQDIE
jgi:long-chain acyl-CoA synthetase